MFQKYLYNRPRKTKGEHVPLNFVAFLRASLSKLAGNRYIQPELIDVDFWTKMPLKFSAVKFYDKSLVITYILSIYYPKISFFFK